MTSLTVPTRLLRGRFSLLTQPARLMGNRPNIKKPKHPSWARQKLLEMSRPVYPVAHPTTEHLWRECPRHEELLEEEARKVPNDWEMIYVRQLEAFLAESAMIGIVHANSMKTRPQRRAWQTARRAGMELCSYEPVMGYAALRGTKWENLTHFFDTCTVANQYSVFGKEVNVGKLLDLYKKTPEIVLLGGVVYDRILSKEQLQELRKMPDLDGMRAELCAVLGAPAQRTRSLLSANQENLSRSLGQLVKDKEDNKS